LNLWIVNEVVQAGGHTLAVCVETEVRLYVMLIGPPGESSLPPASPRSHPSVTVTTPDGVSVPLQGHSGRGGAAESFVVAHFLPPPKGAAFLDVCFTDADGRVESVTRVRPLS
jgi:hypothetical protein